MHIKMRRLKAVLTVASRKSGVRTEVGFRKQDRG